MPLPCNLSSSFALPRAGHYSLSSYDIEGEYFQNQTIYKIDKAWLQLEAIERIGRKLTEEEIFVAKKCVEQGLNAGIHIVFSTAIEEATTRYKYAEIS